MQSRGLLIAAALAGPLLCVASSTNWTEAATYRDMIEARRAGRPAPQPKPAPVARVVGSRNGQVLVETRYPLGGVTTNARTPHVIYRAAEVAANVHARRAYDSAVARLARAVAVQDDADDDSAAASPAALTRQAMRIDRLADKMERETGGDGNGKSKGAAVIGGALAAAAAGYLAAKGRKGRTA